LATDSAWKPPMVLAPMTTTPTGLELLLRDNDIPLE
jgi:hypothetical protein